MNIDSYESDQNPEMFTEQDKNILDIFQRAKSLHLPPSNRKKSNCKNDYREQYLMSYSTDYAWEIKAKSRYKIRSPDNCKSDLIELLQMIYTEDIFYPDLQEYFAFCFSRINNFGSFQQILYNSISGYLQQIKSNIQELLNEIFDFSLAQKIQNCEPHQYFAKGIYKNFGKFSKKYQQIIQQLSEFYDLVDAKGQIIQKIANHFTSHYQKHMKDVKFIHQMKNKIYQHIDCRELHKTLYTETILKDDAIKILLDNLTQLFQDNKFYAQHYKQIMNKVDKLNLYRQKKHGPSITQTTMDPSSSQKYNQIQQYNAQQRNNKPQYKFQIKIKESQQNSFDNSKENTVCSQSSSDKKKKQLQKPNKIKKKKQEIGLYLNYKIEQILKYDEVKEFEKKIELDFEQFKDTEKISLNVTQDWIKRIKLKFVQTLKTL